MTNKLRMEEHTDIGEDIINLLHLKVKDNGRVDTSWGDKTPLGLFLVLQRFIDGKVPR